MLRMQSQQLRQQQPRLDVLVVAADVCNKAAMERAVQEHISRWVCCAMPALAGDSSLPCGQQQMRGWAQASRKQDTPASVAGALTAPRPFDKPALRAPLVCSRQLLCATRPSHEHTCSHASSCSPGPRCRFGSIDTALLCAGIGERGDFLDTSRTTQQLERTLDVDLTAVVAGTRVVAQAMIAAGRGGRIVSIASAAGEHG